MWYSDSSARVNERNRNERKTDIERQVWEDDIGLVDRTGSS